MICRLSLVPRLNYAHSLKDLLISWRGLFFNKPVINFSDDFPYPGHKFFVNSASSGLSIIISSLGISKGSYIGVQAYNCHTVFRAIAQAGMKPLFIDVEKDFCISINDLKRKSLKIKALIVTHTFGQPADIDTIKEILHGIPLIEDCAHSFLSKYKGMPTGNFGVASVLSLGKGKFPSVGDGGIIIVNDSNILKKIQDSTKKLVKPPFIFEIFYPIKYLFWSFIHHKWIYRITKRLKDWLIRSDYPFEMKVKKPEKILKSNLSLFVAKLKDYQRLMNLQQENWELILGRIESINNGEGSCYIRVGGCFLVPVLLKDNIGVSEELYNHGFELGKHFSSSIKHAEQYNYKPGDCPVSEEICSSIITIPSHYNYKRRDLVDLLRCFSNYTIKPK